MKRMSAVLLVLSAVLYAPPHTKAQNGEAEIFRQEGIASWYGPEFDGRPTASGEIFNSSFLTAAHPTLPYGTMLRVTNRHNNKQVMVRVNDRGPFVSARIIDVSRAAAEQLDMISTGTAPVLVESVERIVVPSPANRPETPDPYWTVPPSQPAVTQQPAPAPVYVPPSPVTEAPPPASQVPPPVYTPPAPAYTPPPATLTPALTPAPDKKYRLQVGAYKIAKNAVDAFDKLKNTGLSPAYERAGEYFRVVLAGIPGSDIQSVTEKLGAVGFREALIREER
jgi:rare lipoprotein A